MSRGMENNRDATGPPGRIASELADRLVQAIEEGDDAAFLGGFPETFGAENWTWWAEGFLSRAIRRGRVEVVSALLEAGCPAHDVDEYGFTPLMDAAHYGRLEIARLLLEAGADPDVVAEDYGDGRCALHLALYSQHWDLVELLEPVTRLEVRVLANAGVMRRQEADARGCRDLSIDTRRLFMAAQYPDVEKLRTAIANGADVNALLPPSSSKQLLGSTPLSSAAGRGRPDLVDLLLQAGADPGLTDHTGRTAADFAALNGHHEIAEALRPKRNLPGPAMCGGSENESGAFWRSTGPQKRIADELAGRLYQAILDGDDQTFLESFPGTFGAEGWGWWAGETLRFAIEHARVRVVSALLEAGCSACDTDEHGFTTLMHVAWHGHLEIARLLLEAGADPDVVAEDYGDGRCALHLALYQGHRDVVDLLEPVTCPEVRVLAYEGVERRREADARDEVANGPRLSVATVRLFMAAQSSNVEDLRQAIADGADVNAFLRPEASDYDLGSSPLSFAAGRGRPDLVDLLLQAGADPGLPDHLGRTAADFAAFNGHDAIAEALRPETREGG